jgi:uncharacterized protein DUF1353
MDAIGECSQRHGRTMTGITTAFPCCCRFSTLESSCSHTKSDERKSADTRSIPPIFFSVLRADGEYAYAAVIHYYLYWTQTRPREEADEILKLAMQDLKVDSIKLTAIYKAVRHFGGKAWIDNARLKSQGQKRILVKFQDDPTINWDDWKKRPDVFAT